MRHSMAAMRGKVRSREHPSHFRNMRIGAVRETVTGNAGDAHLRPMQHSPRHRGVPQPAQSVPLVSPDDDEIGVRLAGEFDQTQIDAIRRRQDMHLNLMIAVERARFLQQIMRQHLLHLRRARRARRQVRRLFAALFRVTIDIADGHLAGRDFRQLLDPTQRRIRGEGEIRADKHLQRPLVSQPSFEHRPIAHDERRKPRRFRDSLRDAAHEPAPRRARARRRHHDHPRIGLLRASHHPIIRHAADQPFLDRHA